MLPRYTNTPGVTRAAPIVVSAAPNACSMPTNRFASGSGAAKCR